MEKTLPMGVTIPDGSMAMSMFPPKTDANGNVISGVILKNGTLERARRGDWIRFLLVFPQGSAESVKREHEFITAMVSSVSGAAVKARVLTNPEQSGKHGLKYGDDVTLSFSQILEHVSAAEGESERTAYLLTDLRPISPLIGRTYWTRDGATALIWTQLSDQAGMYLLGEISWPAGFSRAGERDIQWHLDGRHRRGNVGLDIVKDPSESEVIQG
jgi:hypothetical protein